MANKTVHEPHVQAHRSTTNVSSRNGVKPNLIVLHDTESHDRDGLSDVESLLAWFANPSAQVSIHIIVDGEGNSGRCVPDLEKAWHCMSYNSQSLGIEQVGFATYTNPFWTKNNRKQLVKVARWIAWWSKAHGIPIRDARKGGSGVTTHAALGVAGGGHHDPGINYPFKVVLALARHYAREGW